MVPEVNPTTTIRPSNATTLVEAAYASPPTGSTTTSAPVRPRTPRSASTRSPSVRSTTSSQPRSLATPTFSAPPTTPTTRRARRLRELDRGRADAAGGGVHEDRLARAQPGPPVQGEPARSGSRCRARQRRRRRGQRVRDGRSAPAPARTAARPPCGRASIPSTRVPTREASTSGPTATDLAAGLDPRRERQRRAHLVLPGGQQHVREVERGGVHPQEHLARTRGGHVDVGEAQGVGRPAVLDHLPRPHRGRQAHPSPPAWLMPPSRVSVWPVVHAASSLSRYATAAATSSGSPSRFSG